VKKAFIIGPFFTKSEEKCMKDLKSLISRNYKVVTPLDIGYEKNGSENLFSEDLKAIRQSDVIFAILDGHDAGTMSEIGYAKALKKSITGIWTDKERRLDPFIEWLCNRIIQDIDQV
jgi:nucleoside 2-deoxyribosyltransferase